MQVELWDIDKKTPAKKPLSYQVTAHNILHRDPLLSQKGENRWVAATVSDTGFVLAMVIQGQMLDIVQFDVVDDTICQTRWRSLPIAWVHAKSRIRLFSRANGVVVVAHQNARLTELVVLL
ncbi:MAG: hypothetical protein GY703_05060 [Gammaproteobacteria bacterium]|nr:hypothetical protein [Gammaproteobacteria bacterium]